MAPLTSRQQEVLGYIREHINQHGYPPSVREIGQGVGLASSGTVQHHLDELQAKGYIFRRQDSRRTIQVLKPGWPERAVPLVPLVGQVAAGQPILAVENVEDYVPVPASSIRGSEGCFALRVRGDSMVDAGVWDKDVVIVRPQQDAEDGAIVVARIENPEKGETEVTVKRLRRVGKTVRLDAANPAYPTLKPKDLVIEGVVVGLTRSY